MGAAIGLVVVALAGCRGAAPDTSQAEFATLIARGVGGTLTAAAPAAPTRPGPTSVPAHSATAAPTSALATAGAAAATTATPKPPTSSIFTDAAYELDQQRLIGPYAVRIWRNAAGNADSLGVDRILTVERADLPPVKVEFFQALGAETGRDLTGDGTPELVVKTFTGGAHCCFNTVIFSLGSTLTKLLDTPPGNCAGELQDLDGDGRYEFLTCDDGFAYVYCPYAASPSVTAVLAYEPERGYAPASPRFADVYAPAIAAHTQLAEAAQPGALGEWDATTKCAVLPLVLDYLYSGQSERAWDALDRYYQAADRDQFRQSIEAALAASPYFATQDATPTAAPAT